MSVTHIGLHSQFHCFSYFPVSFIGVVHRAMTCVTAFMACVTKLLWISQIRAGRIRFAKPLAVDKGFLYILCTRAP